MMLGEIKNRSLSRPAASFVWLLLLAISTLRLGTTAKPAPFLKRPPPHCTDTPR
jgi:hypothetical protein